MIVKFALAIFALPAFGLLVGIGATIAGRRRVAGGSPSPSAQAAPRQISISLPETMVEAIDVRLERGDYASMDELVLDGLRALFKQERREEE
jgi:hypothetical protein